jgi:uncharacterized peroxidase-related enzyme
MVHHGAGLRRLTKDAELVRQLKEDWQAAPLTARQRVILGYAHKLTVEPWQMARADLEPMRAAGLSDAEILAANQVAAYYAYVNRLADGLGVQIEEYADQD